MDSETVSAVVVITINIIQSFHLVIILWKVWTASAWVFHPFSRLKKCDAKKKQVEGSSAVNTF